MIPFPNRKYNVIYADPPWNYKRYSGFINKKTNADELYKIMSLEEIKDLPISNITDDPCILFLWAVSPLLQDGLDVVSSWGFEYKTIGFAWNKLNRRTSPLFQCGQYRGMGRYTRSGIELCLLATKGQATKLIKNHTIPQVVNAIVTKHSEKPSKVRDRIVELVGDLPRIELFARHKIVGWDQWGLEVPEEPQEIKPLEAFI